MKHAVVELIGAGPDVHVSLHESAQAQEDHAVAIINENENRFTGNEPGLRRHLQEHKCYEDGHWQVHLVMATEVAK